MLIQLDPLQTGPLGIHVLPYRVGEGQCEGLIIKDIQPHCRIDRDGRISVGDRIIEVNDQTLLDVNFEDAQQIIAAALQTNDIRLKILKISRLQTMTNTSIDNVANLLFTPTKSSTTQQLPNPNQTRVYDMEPPPVPPKSTHHYSNGASKVHTTNYLNADYVNFEQMAHEMRNEVFTLDTEERQIDSMASATAGSNAESVDLSDDSASAANKASATMSTSSRSSKTNTYSACNTRKIGKKYHICLVKGHQGLGFSVTTRDNQIGQCPIYIKTILPNGAAIEDGQLKQGDRLLEVNGIEMTGKTHSEVVSVLRSIPTGSEVQLLVSRQEAIEPSSADDEAKDSLCSIAAQIVTQQSPKLPRKLTTDKIESDPIAANSSASTSESVFSSKQVITLSIPLNDTGSAGLGVSVKGKTSATNGGSTCRDLGIFVKSVFHGGAAFKDGRLRPNDQLMKINGINLLTLSNVQAMDMLRRVVVTNDGPDALPNAINLTIARSTRYVENASDGDTIGENIYGRLMHRRDISTVSTDSVQINGRPDALEIRRAVPEEVDDDDDNVFERTFDRSNATMILASCDLHKSINESENHRKNQFYDEQQPKYEEKGRFNDMTSQSSALDRPETFCTPSKSGYRKPFGFLTPNRVDCHIEDDNDQENNDPNVYQRTMLQKLQGTSNAPAIEPSRKFGSLCALETATLDDDPEDSVPNETEVANLSSVTSQMSLNDEERDTFQRDGFGRQSMSEKRHAQLDVKQTDTYKRNRQRRQQMEMETQSENNRSEQQINQPLQQQFTQQVEPYEGLSNKKSGLFAAACCCSFGSQMTKSESQSSPSSCPYHGHSQSPQTERSILSPQSSCSNGIESNNTMLDTVHANALIVRNSSQTTPSHSGLPILAKQSAKIHGIDALSHLGLPHNPTIAERTQQHVHQWQQQQQWMQPQPHPRNRHAAHQNGLPLVNITNPNVPNSYGAYGAPFGMKKSCSLESMQTIMQEMQREKNDHRSPANLPESYRFKTLKVGRNRPTNESFRTAVDRSYPTGDPRNPMETVSEEFGDVMVNPNRTMLNHNMHVKAYNGEIQSSGGLMCKPSTTSIGTVLSNATTTASQFTNDFNDEEIGLIRRRSTGSSKKKSGILRTLFRFGSKKFKDKEKQAKANATSGQIVKKELEEEVEKIRARKAALYEQERIQEYYRRLLDQQKFNESVQQQKQPAIQQQLHAPVQSRVYPQTVLSKASTTVPNVIRPSLDCGLYAAQTTYDQSNHNETTNRLRNSYQTEAGLRVIENTQRWVNKQATMHFNNAQTLTPKLERRREHLPKRFETIHSRSHSYDIKDAIQRNPGSRVGIVDTDNNFTHYMNYKDQMANEQFERRAKEVISSRNMANGVSPLYGMSMGSRGQSQMTAPQIISNCIPPNLLNMPVQVPRRSSFHQKTNSLHKKRTRPLSDYEIETYGGDVGSAPINFSPNQIYDARSSYRMQPETNAYGSVNVPLAQAQQFPGYVNRNMYTAV